MADSEFENYPDEWEEKSKSQLKRESEGLKDLGATLVSLTPGALEKIPLDGELADAIKLAQRINKKKDGYRRQLQFIGKLMRGRDTQPIEEALEKLQNSHQYANRHFHMLEQLRDSIVAKGDKAINDIMEEHAHLDRQKLRQLARQAAKEHSENKPPKSAREIFQYLKEMLPLHEQ